MLGQAQSRGDGSEEGGGVVWCCRGEERCRVTRQAAGGGKYLPAARYCTRGGRAGEECRVGLMKGGGADGGR